MATVAKKSEKKVDEYGFTKGTNVGKLFGLLVKGAKMNALKKVTGKATYVMMSSFRKHHKDDRWGRSAVIKKDDTGTYKIQKFQTPKAA